MEKWKELLDSCQLVTYLMRRGNSCHHADLEGKDIICHLFEISMAKKKPSVSG